MLRIGICIEGTFIPSFEGATQRFQALAWYLTKEGADVTILHCYRGWSDKTAIAQQPYRTYFIPPPRYYSDINLLTEIIEEHQIDLLIFSEFVPVLAFGWVLKQRIPRLKLYFEVHDIHFNLTRSQGSSAQEARQLLRLEHLAYLTSDLCVCFTNEDKASVEHILRQEVAGEAGAAHTGQVFNCEGIPVHSEGGEALVPPVVRLPFGSDTRLIAKVGPNLSSGVLLFLGNLFHGPNRRAVEFLAEVVQPAVVSAVPQTRFLIVGDAPRPIVDRYAGAAFLFAGKVPDLNSVFRETTLAVAPIFNGTGIKVKMLDYCAAGLPVVCTTRAARGILDEGQAAFCIEDDPDLFASRVIQLLSDSQALVDMGAAAARQVRRQQWPLIIKETIALYEEYRARPGNPATETLKAALSNIKLDSYFLDRYLNPGRFQDNGTSGVREVSLGGFGAVKTR